MKTRQNQDDNLWHLRNRNMKKKQDDESKKLVPVKINEARTETIDYQYRISRTKSTDPDILHQSVRDSE